MIEEVSESWAVIYSRQALALGCIGGAKGNERIKSVDKVYVLYIGIL